MRHPKVSIVEMIYNRMSIIEWTRYTKRDSAVTFSAVRDERYRKHYCWVEKRLAHRQISVGLDLISLPQLHCVELLRKLIFIDIVSATADYRNKSM